LTLIVLGALAASNALFAADLTWAAPIGGTWETATNWNPAQVPATTDKVTLIDLPAGQAVSLATGKTVAGLTLSPNARLHYQLASDTSGRKITVNGNLVLDGQVQVSDIGGFKATTYILIKYSGTLTNNGMSVTGLPPGFGGAIEVNTSKKQIELVVTTLGALRNPENPGGTIAGLKYTYTEGTFTQAPHGDTIEPKALGTTPGFDLSVKQRSDNFGLRFTGFVNVPQDGLYTFYTKSDEGSLFYIGRTLVVNNDGIHTATEKSGKIALKAGVHALTASYFEATGSEVLEVRWQGPNLAKELIPTSKLSSIPSSNLILAKDDVYPLEGNQPLTVGTAQGVLANDDHTQGQPLSAQLVAAPANASSFALNPDGSFSYTPNPTFFGTDRFTYKAVNGAEQSNTATVRIAISGGEIEMKLSTSTNGHVIMKSGGAFFGRPGGVGEVMTIRTPWTTAKVTVQLSQSGVGGVYYGSSGTNTSTSIQTSGGVNNLATIVVRHRKTSGSGHDLCLSAIDLVSGRRGERHATPFETKIFNPCRYLADRRTVTLNVQLTPPIKDVGFDPRRFFVPWYGNTASPFPLPLPYPVRVSDAKGTLAVPLAPLGTNYYQYIQILPLRDTGTTVSTESPYESIDVTEPGDGGYDYAPPGDKKELCDICLSGDYYDEGKPIGPGRTGSVKVSDGEKKMIVDDLSIQGRGMPYAFRRAYRSHNYRQELADRGYPVVRDFGENWTFSYADDYLLKVGSAADSQSSYIWYRDLQSGSVWVNAAANKWTPSLQDFKQLRILPGGDLEIRDPYGMTWIYHGFSNGSPTPGRLKTIRDRNENTITCHYRQIDPDGTAGNGDQKYILAFVVDTLGREIRYRYYAASEQFDGSANERNRLTLRHQSCDHRSGYPHRK
jgi:hypothetical protein